VIGISYSIGNPAISGASAFPVANSSMGVQSNGPIPSGVWAFGISGRDVRVGGEEAGGRGKYLTTDYMRRRSRNRGFFYTDYPDGTAG